MTSYVETWAGIARVMRRDQRWCAQMANRTEDPLPVLKVGRTVRMNMSDLDDWLKRQRDRALESLQEHAKPANAARKGVGR